MSATEPQTSRALFSEHWRHDVDQMVSSNTQKDSKKLAKMVQELVYNVAQRHNNHSNQTPTLDWDLHDLWYTLIKAACIRDADSADQDTLASYVIHARELGPLRRGSTHQLTETTEETETPTHSKSQGGLEDLQYLASDLEDFWINTSYTLSPQHRQNLSAFTARLVALGIQDKNLISCGIHLLRQTLEVPQSLSQLVGETTTTSLEDLLPASITLKRRTWKSCNWGWDYGKQSQSCKMVFLEAKTGGIGRETGWDVGIVYWEVCASDEGC
ncbi:hypothetical protein KCU92_g6974, partial [Aureobasidium melanogenum]